MIFGNKEQILYGNRFNGTKGNGYQPKKVMTNFENITKSEESLAEWLGDLLDNEVCDPGNWNCKKCFKWCHRDKVVEWLKQPHRGDRE